MDTWVGRSLARREDRALLTGEAMFVADLADERLTDAGRAAFVRSPIAHGRIVSIDVDEARRSPGVRLVLTAEENPVVPAGGYAAPIHPQFAHPLLAEGKVRYVGQPIVAVVADTEANALEAAEAVVVDIEPLRAVVDLDDALSNEVLLFEPGDGARVRPGGAASVPHELGNVVIDAAGNGGPVGHDAAMFEACDIMVQARLTNPRQSPAPIEPRRMACAWDGPALQVWAATQIPHWFRDRLAAMLDIDGSLITVIAGPNVGGGFGGKVTRTPEEMLIPVLARMTSRPVRWDETRSEYFLTSTQGRGERFDMTLGGSADGTLRAIRTDMVKDCGAYPLVGALLPAAYTLPMAAGPYDIGHIEMAMTSVATNLPATSAFRGAGRAPYIAALERMVDLFASTAGLDPAEVRRRNLLRREQMPHTTAVGTTYDEADYLGDLERVLVAADYEGLRRRQAERRAAGGKTRMLGIGIASYNHKTVGGGGEEATVSVEADGSAVIITGTSTQGHGHETVWSQIAADVLGIDPHRIRVEEGSTALTATGMGAIGSRSVQTAGVAIHTAATDVVDRARRLAADLLEAAEGDVVFDRDRAAFHVLGTPSISLDWAQIGSRSQADGVELTCGEFHDTHDQYTFPSGSHVAVVEVDAETGGVEVVEYHGVDDAGVRVNPATVDGQLHGGISSGIAQALGEAMNYDADGNPLTSSFIDYAIGTADQVPFFQLVGAETATSINEHGFKGVGESGITGATPAVHNAIVDALAPLGVTHIDLPCTPEAIWMAIDEASVNER